MALALAAGIVRHGTMEGIRQSRDVPLKELTDTVTVAAATGNVASGGRQGISYPHFGSSEDATDPMVIDYAPAQGTVIEGHSRDEGILVCADCGGGRTF